MKRSWLTAQLGVMAMLVVAGAMAVATVEAKPEPEEERPKEKPKVEWSEPTVQGILQRVWWAESYVKGEWTPTGELFSNESDMMITIYGDNPQVKELFANGTACAGRFVVATGTRIDEGNLSAHGIEVPNLNMACTGTVGEPPKRKS